MENWGVPKVRGRGMVKFQPFASLPEQYEGIREIIENLNKVSKPILTEDTKERIERALINSIQYDQEVLISYYREGIINNMYINVSHIDSSTKTVHCTDAFGLNTEFKIDEFVDVE
ncbi:YolD-like family protein [Bacillus sp. BS98]|uniref:YolD-like family protein n=1 Tax=Bacillus sp. BS98 TaxID=2608254 RepID=UPI00122F23F0|nr:YolD-like family protein [Bacillus sp. BS98]QEQ20769.1 YolD-like family protein [Bacillus sp. BS98]